MSYASKLSKEKRDNLIYGKWAPEDYGFEIKEIPIRNPNNLGVAEFEIVPEVITDGNKLLENSHNGIAQSC